MNTTYISFNFSIYSVDTSKADLNYIDIEELKKDVLEVLNRVMRETGY